MKMKRVSLMLGEDQHEHLSSLGLNVSALVRDLLDDYLNDSKITLRVQEQTKMIYDQIIANTGTTDEDLEPFLLKALKEVLRMKMSAIEKLSLKLDSNE